MIYLYGNPRSEGLKALGQAIANISDVEVVGGQELERAKANSLVICWGYSLPRKNHHTLNVGGPKGNKWLELNLLKQGNVSIPNFILGGQSKPTGWLARRFHHHSANDLRRNLRRGDYYVEQVDCVSEYRIHVLLGKVRVGLKVAGKPNADPIFRTHSLGWIFKYGAITRDNVPTTVVQEAKKAVAAVGYDFGVVDVGVKRDETPVVFEVNSAPNLSNATALWYAKSFLAYYREL